MIITTPCQIGALHPRFSSTPNNGSQLAITARSAVDPHEPSLLAHTPWSRDRHMDNLLDSMHERVDRGLHYQPSRSFSLPITNRTNLEVTEPL